MTLPEPEETLAGEPANDAEFDLDSSSDDSDELGFDMDDLAEAEAPSSELMLI